MTFDLFFSFYFFRYLFSTGVLSKKKKKVIETYFYPKFQAYLELCLEFREGHGLHVFLKLPLELKLIVGPLSLY